MKYILTTLKNLAYTCSMAIMSINFWITFNVVLLTLSIRSLLQYHPHEVEVTIYNILLVFFMCSIPILISSLFQYGTGNIRKFRNIIWSIFIAVIIVFLLGCIMNYLFRDYILFLSYLIAHWKAENMMLMDSNYSLRPGQIVNPDLNRDAGYIASNVTELITPYFSFKNGIYSITGERTVNIEDIINGRISAQPYAYNVHKAMEHSLGHSFWGSDTQLWSRMSEKFNPSARELVSHVSTMNNPGITPYNSQALRTQVSILP